MIDIKKLRIVTEEIILDSDEKITSSSLIEIIKLYKKLKMKIGVNLNYEKIEFKIKDINNILNNSYKYLEILDINRRELIENIKIIKDKNIREEKICIRIKNFISLKELSIDYDREIRNEDIKNLKNLEILELPKNMLISNIGIKNLNNLKKLNLKSNENIKDEYLRGKNLMEELTLVNNKNISDNGLRCMSNLRYLNLGYNNNKELRLEFIKDIKLETLIIYKKKNISEEIKERIKLIPNVFAHKMNIIKNV
jgi:hypothetical protein